MSMGKYVLGLLSTVLLYFPGLLGGGLGTAQAQAVICVFDNVPAGYVITAAVSSASCPGGDAYRIELPAENQLICPVSPLPPPYVVVDVDSSNTTTCRGTNRYKIKQAIDGMHVCAFSKIPAGFVITGNVNLACGASGSKKYEIRVESLNANPCSFTPVPESSQFAVVDVVASSKCGIGFREFRFGYPGDGVYSYTQWPTPVGYVIASTVLNKFGTGYAANLLRTPYPGVIVCSYSPVPDGWYRAGTVSTNSCAGSTTGYRLQRL